MWIYHIDEIREKFTEYKTLNDIYKPYRTTKKCQFSSWMHAKFELNCRINTLSRIEFPWTDLANCCFALNIVVVRIFVVHSILFRSVLISIHSLIYIFERRFSYHVNSICCCCNMHSLYFQMFTKLTVNWNPNKLMKWFRLAVIGLKLIIKNRILFQT